MGMQQEQIVKHLLLEIIQTKNDVVLFVDEGASASSLNRLAMSKMIELVKQGAVESIVTYDLSRVSRDIFDSTVFLKLMSKHNVVFKCLHDDVNIATAGNRFLTNVKIAVNQFEREKIIERTNDGLISIVESGRYPCGGRLPFGYDRDENKQIVVNEKEADIIKKQKIYWLF